MKRFDPARRSSCGSIPQLGCVHRNVQSNSRKDVFLDCRLRVAAVLRDYGMTERE